MWNSVKFADQSNVSGREIKSSKLKAYLVTISIGHTWILAICTVDSGELQIADIYFGHNFDAFFCSDRFLTTL
jgi:hypothetical protein